MRGRLRRARFVGERRVSGSGDDNAPPTHPSSAKIAAVSVARSLRSVADVSRSRRPLRGLAPFISLSPRYFAPRTPLHRHALALRRSLRSGGSLTTFPRAGPRLRPSNPLRCQSLALCRPSRGSCAAPKRNRASHCAHHFYGVRVLPDPTDSFRASESMAGSRPSVATRPSRSRSRLTVGAYWKPRDAGRR